MNPDCPSDRPSERARAWRSALRLCPCPFCAPDPSGTPMSAAFQPTLSGTRCYQRRRPEHTRWYRTVQAHFATWLIPAAELATCAAGRKRSAPSGLAIGRSAITQTEQTRGPRQPKTRAILGLRRLNFLSVCTSNHCPRHGKVASGSQGGLGVKSCIATFSKGGYVKRHPPLSVRAPTVNFRSRLISRLVHDAPLMRHTAMP